MPRYAAFLRGVNLAGKRRTSSAELRSCFEGLGLEEVATFRTSGNVVFGAAGAGPAKLGARIEAALERSFGFEVEVFLRTGTEIKAIAERRPFADEVLKASTGKLQVSMLSTKPTAGVREQVLALATDEDSLAFGERELYWLPSGNTSDSALDLKAIAKLLGSTTRRTVGTVELLAAKYFER